MHVVKNCTNSIYIYICVVQCSNVLKYTKNLITTIALASARLPDSIYVSINYDSVHPAAVVDLAFRLAVFQSVNPKKLKLDHVRRKRLT